MRAAVTLLALLASVPATALAQEEIFAQGNQAYQEGDFAAAVEAYEAVRAAGFESVDLHYNLGNAYFKRGDLGLAILEWERARARAPRNPDVEANLELARSLTADVVEPLPRFWVLSVVSWWVHLLSRGTLIAITALGWLLATGGAVARILARGSGGSRLAGWLAGVGVALTLVFGTNLAARELGIGQPDHAVILAESVPVRSAPAEDDDLTLFEVHEGTVVRIDERSGDWAEVVLADGKVGWVRHDVMEVI